MEKARLILTEEEARDMESLLSLTIPVIKLDVPIASVPFSDGHVAELSIVKRRLESEIHPFMTLFDKNGDEEDWRDGTDPYGTWEIKTGYGMKYEVEVVDWEMEWNEWLNDSCRRDNPPLQKGDILYSMKDGSKYRAISFGISEKRHDGLMDEWTVTVRNADGNEETVPMSSVNKKGWFTSHMPFETRYWKKEEKR